MIPTTSSNSDNRSIDITVVIPCYKSAQTIEHVVTLTSREIESLGLNYEFILVNDCSTDNTFNNIQKLCSKASNIKGLNLSKNAGQHNAIIAGLQFATGKFILCMDDDLQTHPQEIKKLVSKAQEGWDVVFARYPLQKQTLFRKIGTSFTRWTIRTLTDRPHNIYASSFWIAKKHVCEELKKYTSPNTYIQGLLFRATQNITDTEVTHYQRAAGISGYSFTKLVRQWATILHYSILPLRIATILGTFIGFLGLLGAGVIIIKKILDPSTQLGWSSVMVIILSCFGFNLICIGIVGEYLGRIFMAIDKHPQFVVSEKINC